MCCRLSFFSKNSDTAVSHMLCHHRKIIISGWEKGKGRKRQRPRRRGGRATNRFNIFVFTGKGNRRLISRTAVSTFEFEELNVSKNEGKEKCALFVFFCFSAKTTYVRFVQVHVTESRFFLRGRKRWLASTIFFVRESCEGFCPPLLGNSVQGVPKWNTRSTIYRTDNVSCRNKVSDVACSFFLFFQKYAEKQLLWTEHEAAD